MTEVPYSVPIDGNTARDLAEQGAAVLMLGVPPGSYIGVDHQVFAAGPKFKGVKMIPPGAHFFSCRATGGESATAAGMGGMAPPSGFFLFLTARQVVVKVWNVETEQLLDMQCEDEAGRYAEGVRRFDFDAFLAPYDLGSMRRWHGLSCHIDADLISTISPVGGNISITAEAEDPDLLNPKTAAERDLVKQLQEGRARMLARQEEEIKNEQIDSSDAPDIPQVTISEPSCSPDVTVGNNEALHGRRGGRCFYTHLPRLIKQQGLSAAELTAQNLDKSTALIQAADQIHGGKVKAFLGELQFAFIAFIFGQSLDGFTQWKSLLMLLLGCEDAALNEHQSMFTEMLRLVRLQLEVSLGPSPGAEVEGQEAFGMALVEDLLPDSFLRRMFGRFFQCLQENGGEVRVPLQREASNLKQLLRARLGWEYDIQIIGDFPDDDEEDMPTIVDIEEPWAF